MIEPLNQLIEAFRKLPGIGQKQAERFALFILKSPRNKIDSFISAIMTAKKVIKTCPICCSYCERIPCRICSDMTRDRTTICIVENYVDLLAIERTGRYKGVYHVLLGALSPLDGIHQNNLSTGLLIKRLTGIKEILIATNPTVEGDATAIYIVQLLRPYNIKITRLAKGIPSGGNIEYADEITLVNALDGRKEI